MLPLLTAVLLLSLQAAEPSHVVTVHCTPGNVLRVDEAPAPPCPFELEPEQSLTLSAGSQVVLEGQGLRPWSGPLPLQPSERWEGAAEPLEGEAARAWLERLEVHDLGLLLSLETSSLFRAGRSDEALARIETALSETPGHRSLLALRQAHRHKLGLPLAESHTVSPALEEETPANQGNGTRNVFGADDRVPVTSSSYPWRAIGLISPQTCTGALVSERWVLTAAHCVTKQGDRGALRDELLTFYAGAQGGYSSVNAKAVGAWIPDGWTLYGSREHDWALIELDKDLGNQVGWFGIASTSLSSINRSRRYQQAGYSYDRLGGRTATADTDCGIRNTEPYGGVLLVDCDMAQGDSGSPMFIGGSSGATIHALMVAERRYGSDDSLYLSYYSDEYASIAIPLADAAWQLKRLREGPPQSPPRHAADDLYHKGRQQLADGMPNTAANTLASCVAIDSQHTGCWWEFGWAEWARGNYSNTVIYWEYVAVLNPNWPELYRYLPQARSRANGAW